MKIVSYKTNVISRFNLVFFLYVCFVGNSIAQTQNKKNLTTADYKLWHTLNIDKISTDGKWISYGLFYDDGIDTVFVENVNTNKKFSIPNAFFSDFSPDGKWAFSRTIDQVLHSINLTNGNITKVQGVSRYKISPNSNAVAYLKHPDKNVKSQLIIENLVLNKNLTFDNVEDFEFSATGQYLAFAQNNPAHKKMMVYSVKDHSFFTLIESENNDFSYPVWTHTGLGLAFFQESNSIINRVNWYANISKPNALKSFNPISNDLKVEKNQRPTMLFSKDDSKLFFQASNLVNKSIPSTPQNVNVEIWNAKDELLYPGYQLQKEYLQNPSKMLVWHRDSDRWGFIGDSINTLTIFGDNYKFAYNYSYKHHSIAHAESEQPSSISVCNLNNMESKPIIEKPNGLEFQMSPSGTYLAYFKDKNWWVYNAENNNHTNVTLKINQKFHDSKSKNSVPEHSYGNPGWTKDEKQIILYDEYDIWLITPDGLKSKRITNGREHSRVYRLYKFLESPFNTPRFVSQNANIFDVTTKVILSARDIKDERTGYFTYGSSYGLKEIDFSDFSIKNLRLSADRSKVIFSKEKYDTPPKLVYHNLNSSESKEVKQTNRHHDNYHWGHSELINFETPLGDSLKGALFYPANFDPNKKYPMLVYCYEILSKYVHDYEKPTLYDSTGFSVFNYTSNDYFVFYPDIVYEVGNPGMSAVTCITSGVKEVLKAPYIDENKLGIYGHSFGGYETMFLITQTDMFATAVAGAGASNMLSYYLSMAWLWNRPQYWRFEKQQWRMGDSYFNIPEAYERNSPIHQLNNVSTPLLSWAGKLDTNVNWEQHLEMYLGLRRLKKDHIMLLYPEEGHDIVRPENQVDVTTRINEWFNYYLKGSPQPKWMMDTH